MSTIDLPTRIARTRAALGRYRVMAWVTGVFLLILCVEMLLKYVVFRFWMDGSGLLPYIEWIPYAHGWVYVVYLVTVIDLWTRMRWGFGRLAAMVFGGVVPIMSFVVETRVHHDADELLTGAQHALDDAGHDGPRLS
ncbi:MAG: DUF3817 domain-containing protein [Cellulomonadaceae bacterium]